MNAFVKGLPHIYLSDHRRQPTEPQHNNLPNMPSNPSAMGYERLNFLRSKAHIRSRKVRVVLITGLAVFLLVSLPMAMLHILRQRSFLEDSEESFLDDSTPCSPEAYSSGRWVWDPRTSITKMTHKEQAFLFSGIESCASDREVWWNLGADKEEQFFRFPKAQSYKWHPGKACWGLRPLDSEKLLKDLVEKGGWYLVGGSFHCHFQRYYDYNDPLWQTLRPKTISFRFLAFLVITLLELRTIPGLGPTSIACGPSIFTSIQHLPFFPISPYRMGSTFLAHHWSPFGE